MSEMAGLYVRVLRMCIAASLAALATGLALYPVDGGRVLGAALWVVVASPYLALASLAVEERDRRIRAEVAFILLLVALDVALSLGVGLAGG